MQKNERDPQRSEGVTIPPKSKTTGGASPVVLEVYHEVEAGLPEGQLPPTDLAGYLDHFIHDHIS
jgi:hypothetical protein